MKLNDLIVISGGQTGVDIAALLSAKTLGLKTGGMAPKNFQTVCGKKKDILTRFNLIESSGNYNKRTRENIDATNGTIIFARNFESSGTNLTKVYCSYTNKPYILINENYTKSDVEKVVMFINNIELSTLTNPIKLNFAGNSSKSAPKIFDTSFRFFCEVFSQYIFNINISNQELNMLSKHASNFNNLYEMN